MSPRLIIFDLDGTLIDSAPDIHRAIDRMLDEFGLASLPYETMRPMIGDGARLLVERVLAARPGSGATVERGLERYLAHYHEAPAGLTSAYPGVAATLTELAARDVTLAISTNKPASLARPVLDALGLAHHFVDLIGGDTYPFRKPDPRMLTLLIERHRAGRAATLMVGDSEVDAETCGAAEVPLVLVTCGYRRGPAEGIPALARIDRFDQLLDLV